MRCRRNWHAKRSGKWLFVKLQVGQHSKTHTCRCTAEATVAFFAVRLKGLALALHCCHRLGNSSLHLSRARVRIRSNVRTCWFTCGPTRGAQRCACGGSSSIESAPCTCGALSTDSVALSVESASFYRMARFLGIPRRRSAFCRKRIFLKSAEHIYA